MLRVVLLLLIAVYIGQADVYGQVNFLKLPKDSALNGPTDFRRVGGGNVELKQDEFDTVEPANSETKLEDQQKQNQTPETDQETNSNSATSRRDGFNGDRCSTGYARVGGKCVPTKE